MFGSIGGSSGATFTVVDEYFRYLTDRTYYIQPNADYSALGFRHALGVAPPNGTPATYWQHKQNTGDNYITFTAPRDIDVYLMYDRRGGSNFNDDSRDAPWITASGFVRLPHAIAVTDVATPYKVYRKTYLAGEQVILHGNRKGVTLPTAIDTNYWLVLKPAGVTTSGSASELCTTPDLSAPGPVASLVAIPGSAQVRLHWRNPSDTDFAGVVIRRSLIAPPARVTDGNPPTGISTDPEDYLDQGLSTGTTYHYTIFALDANQNIQGGQSISVQTGVDSDGDGLSDAYENNTIHASGQQTNPNLMDTDGDTLNDGVEIANGTDPTNPDTSPPGITQFDGVSPSPTSFPTVTFALSGTDNSMITGWIITTSATKPRLDAAWSPTLPTTHTLSAQGSYTLFAWAKDAAGNISLPAGPLPIDLVGMNIPLFAYASHASPRKITVHRVDPRDGALTQVQEVDPGTSNLSEIRITPDGPLVAIDQWNVWTIALDPVTGLLGTTTSSHALPFRSAGLRVPAQGGGVFVYGSNSVQRFSIDGGGALAYNTSQSFGNSVRDFAAAPGGATGLVTFDTVVNVWNQGLYDQCMGNCCPPLSCSVFQELQCPSTCASSGNVATGVNRATWLTLPGMGLFSSLPDSFGDTRYAYATVSSAGNRAFVSSPGNHAVRGLVGGVEATGAATMPGPTGRLHLSPDERFVYVVVSGNSVHAVGIAGDGSPYYLGSGGTGTLGAIDRFTIEPTGNFVYVPMPGTNQIRTYSVNRVTGALTSTSNSTTTAEPTDVAILARNSDNDPPTIRPADIIPKKGASVGPFGRMEFLPHRVRAGAQVSATLQAVDPDRARCSADPALYTASVTLTAKPGGSALALGILPTLPGATWWTATYGARVWGTGPEWAIQFRFVPDVEGDYTFQVAFTDTPGTCAGAAATATQSVSLHAGPPNEWSSLAQDFLPYGTGDTFSQPFAVRNPGTDEVLRTRYLAAEAAGLTMVSSEYSGSFKRTLWGVSQVDTMQRHCILTNCTPAFVATVCHPQNKDHTRQVDAVDPMPTHASAFDVARRWCYARGMALEPGFFWVTQTYNSAYFFPRESRLYWYMYQ